MCVCVCVCVYVIYIKHKYYLKKINIKNVIFIANGNIFFLEKLTFILNKHILYIHSLCFKTYHFYIICSYLYINYIIVTLTRNRQELENQFSINKNFANFLKDAY